MILVPRHITERQQNDSSRKHVPDTFMDSCTVSRFHPFMGVARLANHSRFKIRSFEVALPTWYIYKNETRDIFNFELHKENESRKATMKHIPNKRQTNIEKKGKSCINRRGIVNMYVCHYIN